MTCPTCYVNSTPEHVPVTINNNVVTLTLNSSEVQWVLDLFEVADSVGGAGLQFFLSKPAVAASQLMAFQDNVPQEQGVAYSVPGTLDRVNLVTALESPMRLVVRYLAYVTSDTWLNQTLYLGNSTSGLGLVFTLIDTPLDSSHIVVLNDGAPLTYVAGAPGAGQYAFSGTTLTLGTALTAGKPLVVTYARTP